MPIAIEGLWEIIAIICVCIFVRYFVKSFDNNTALKRLSLNGHFLWVRKSHATKVLLKNWPLNKNWPNFEHYARVIFIHDLGWKLTTFCAFHMTPRIYGNIAMICVCKEEQVWPLTFGLKVGTYFPLFEHMFFPHNRQWKITQF